MALNFFLIYSFFHIFNKMSFSLWCVFDDFFVDLFFKSPVSSTALSMGRWTSLWELLCVSIWKIMFFIFELYFSPLFFGCIIYEILVPQRGIKPMPIALEAWSLNHWTTREVQSNYFKWYVDRRLLENILIKKENKLLEAN